MSLEKLFVCIFVFSCYVFRLHRLSNFLFHLSYGMLLMLLTATLMDVCIRSHIPCNSEADYIITHWASVLSNLSSWSKQYILAVHYIPCHDMRLTLHLDKNPLNHILSQMFVYTTQKISTTVNV